MSTKKATRDHSDKASAPAAAIDSAPIEDTTPLRSRDASQPHYVLETGGKYFMLNFGPENDHLTDKLAEAVIETSLNLIEVWGRDYNKIFHPKKWSKPLEIKRLVMTGNGLVTGVEPLGDWSPYDQPMKWTSSSQHTIGLAEAAAFEAASADSLMGHKYWLKDSPLWDLLIAEYEEDLRTEVAENDPDYKHNALAKFGARLCYTGIAMGRREQGARNRLGELIFDNPFCMDAVKQTQGGAS